ncbi:MAG TPA: hypothetical protein VIB38_08400 [Aestuariivirgaceae bacterium]|jgi:hypothetical protein
MTHDPYDTENRTRVPPEDAYNRRPYGSGYGGSSIAFVIFGVVAVLLIGFAMFGGYPDNDTVTAPATTEPTTEVQPAQPAAPEPAAPADNNAGTTNQ